MFKWKSDLNVELELDDWYKLMVYASRSYMNTGWPLTFPEPHHNALEVVAREARSSIFGGTAQKFKDFGSVYTIVSFP